MCLSEEAQKQVKIAQQARDEGSLVEVILPDMTRFIGKVDYCKHATAGGPIIRVVDGKLAIHPNVRDPGVNIRILN